MEPFPTTKRTPSIRTTFLSDRSFAWAPLLASITWEVLYVFVKKGRSCGKGKRRDEVRGIACVRNERQMQTSWLSVSRPFWMMLLWSSSLPVSIQLLRSLSLLMRSLPPETEHIHAYDLLCCHCNVENMLGGSKCERVAPAALEKQCQSPRVVPCCWSCHRGHDNNSNHRQAWRHYKSICSSLATRTMIRTPCGIRRQ